MKANGEIYMKKISIDKSTPLPSLPKENAGPVIYKLVRVEGDGTFVPATDDELIEVEDLLQDDKSVIPLIDDQGHFEGSFNEGLSLMEAALEGLEDVPDSSPSEKTEDARNQNGRLEETAALQSTTSNDIAHLASIETCLQPACQSVIEPSVSDICTSTKPDFSTIQGDICLDNMTIRELQETFKATFGRETTVKDKLWLKRRIAMGLSNCCDVSTLKSIIEHTKLSCKKEKGTYYRNDKCKYEAGSHLTDQITGAMNADGNELSTSPTNQMEDHHIVSGKRLRNTKNEWGMKNKDLQTDQTAGKRLRKPTRRYIEELSEIESREYSERLISSIRSLERGQSSLQHRVKPVKDASLAGTTHVTRPDSLGGSGVQVPYVCRVRRARPRKNVMALLMYHPNDLAAKLVQKALGMHFSKEDGANRSKLWKARTLSKRTAHPIVGETEREKEIVTGCGQLQHQKDEEPTYFHSSSYNSDENAMTVTGSKDRIRRKHHRAWTLGEVMKLVEGVSRCGAGKWSEIKRISFASYTYRTSVDLKDKWRNLLRASFSQSPAENGVRNSQKHASLPIPASVLIRVRELAEMHEQVASKQSSSKLAGRRSLSVYETRSTFL